MKIYDYHGKKNVCGDRVRDARQKQRLTQEDLAAKLQITRVKSWASRVPQTYSESTLRRSLEGQKHALQKNFSFFCFYS